MRNALLSLILLILGLTLVASCSSRISDPALVPFNAQVTLTVAALHAEGTQDYLNQQTTSTAQAERETHQALDAQFAQVTLQAAQTQDARQATTMADEATATASVAATAQIQTVTAQTEGTQRAWPLTATPLAATQNAVVRADRESELQAYWNEYVIPARVILPTALVFIVLVLLILGAVLLYPRLTTTLEALEMRLRIWRDERGEESIIVNDHQKIRILHPGRAHGHALRNTPAGVLVDRTPDGPQWQAGVISNEQMIRLVQAMFRNQPAPRQIAHRLFQRLHQQSAALPGREVVDAPEVHLLPPDHPEIQEILADVEPKLIEKMNDGG